MTLKEAHESGRRYRRSKYYSPNCKTFFRYDGGSEDAIRVCDALADDYELEPPKEIQVKGKWLFDPDGYIVPSCSIADAIRKAGMINVHCKVTVERLLP